MEFKKQSFDFMKQRKSEQWVIFEITFLNQCKNSYNHVSPSTKLYYKTTNNYSRQNCIEPMSLHMYLSGLGIRETDKGAKRETNTPDGAKHTTGR